MAGKPEADFPLAAFGGRFRLVRSFAGGEGRTALLQDATSGELAVGKVLDEAVPPAEAALLQSLRHPAIPALRAAGRLPTGQGWLLRDYAAGAVLAEAMPLSPERALDVARQVLEVLAFVHLRSVLHLDLKPQNLVLGDDGRVRLLDFGMSVRQGQRGSGGTPFFAAPEQLLGGAVDARTDLFGLGAVLVAALWPKPGKVPLQRFLQAFPASPFLDACGVTAGEFPPPFAAFLERCLPRRPHRRFHDAQAALEFLTGGSGKPSPELLRPDPVALFGDTLAASAPPGVDLELRSGDPRDRQALALHFLCTLPDARAIQPMPQGLRLQRGGGDVAVLAVPPIGTPALAHHLAAVCGLHAAAAQSAAAFLLQHCAPSAGQLGDRLQQLLEAGTIVPAGARFLWPDAQAGRLGNQAEVATMPSAAAIRTAAAAGRNQAAAALYRRGAAAAPGQERQLRTALAQGLLAAGDPTRALPLCHDLPIERLRALFDCGQVAAAAAALPLARTTAGDGADAALVQRIGAQIQAAQGEPAAAAQSLRGLAAADRGPETTQALAAALEMAGQGDEARTLLVELLPRLPADAPPALRAAIFTALGHAERRLGNLQPSHDCFAHAREQWFDAGHARHAATAEVNLGVVAKDLGQFDEAMQHLRAARSLFEHVGDHGGALIADANLGIVALESGDPVTAEPRLLAAAQGLRQLGNHAAAALATVMLARAQAEQGQHDAATQSLLDVGPLSSARLRTEALRVRELLARREEPKAVPPVTAADDDMPPENQGLSRELFRTFLAVNRRLAQESDLEKAMNYLLEAAVTLTGGRHGYLLVGRPDGLRREYQSGDPGPAGQAFSRSLANRAMQQRRTLTGDDVLADRELKEMPSIRNLQVRSAICAPFRSGAGSEGAIYVEHPGRAGAFQTIDKEALEVLADQASIAVDRMLRDEQLAAELQRSRRDLAVAQRQSKPPMRLLGDSAPMQSLRAQIEKLGPLDLPVLILGETGTGKELVARALHDAGNRRRAPFVAENCSALPAELMERELFGHVQGAFTGADADRPGLFELAQGGTLFLDEVGDMPPALQAKLLRALQEKTIRRIGGAASIPLDVRLLAATHKDLRGMVSAGEFREDLFYRLAAVEVRVPPLRERGADVAVLARHFLEQHDKRHGTRHQLGIAALNQLQAWRWPGNVRELEHVVARACLLGEREEITDLQLPVGAPPAPGAGPAPAGEANTTAAVPPAAAPMWPVLTLAEAERRTVLAALAACGGDKTKAARTLEISRTALYEKLKRYGEHEPGPRPEA